MQDRSYRIDENLLQHAAGPYIRVIRVVLTVGPPLPVYPDKRTSREPDGKSQGGYHYLTFCECVTSLAKHHLLPIEPPRLGFRRKWTTTAA